MSHIPSRRWRATADLAIVGAAAASYFALAVYLELAERMSRWFSGYEHWQLDELPLTLLLLSVGLSWFGWRRWRELGREMRANSWKRQTFAPWHRIKNGPSGFSGGRG